MYISKWGRPKSLEEAEQIQNEMLKYLILRPLDFSCVSLIAGVDVSYTNDEALGIVVVINRNFEVVEIISQKKRFHFLMFQVFLHFERHQLS